MTAFVAFAGLAPVGAQTATPSPSPSPTFAVAIDAHTTFIAESTRGPGTTPPEGPGFAAGSPVSPLTPYDTFSSAPLTPGNALESALYFRPTYNTPGLSFSADLGAGYIMGSTTSAAYWGEPLFDSLNPHLGFASLPYRIVFPTHPGADDGSAFVASILSGSAATRDGHVLLRGGWFDLQQSDSFVFTQPAVTNVAPAIGFATAETLGSGPPNLDWWEGAPSSLPLHGIDGIFKNGLATLELTDAALPALTPTPARLEMGSFVIDHGEGTRYSVQVLHVFTGGALVPTTVLYGSAPNLLFSPQGPLPTSLIGGQRQWVYGARASFHATKSIDGLVEYGHSTYSADSVAEPGTGKAGNYYHAGLTQNFEHMSAGIDAYRNEPYYAQVLLPYGVPENVWSVAWSWPGQWLKSNYQIINDFPVNINREGYRAHYSLEAGPVQVKLAYGNFGQIDPISMSNALQTGFIDGFFLPQANGFATLGRQHQYGLWGDWRTGFGDFTVDYDEDTMRRLADPSQPQDSVAYDAPSWVLGLSRHISPAVLGSIAYGRYAMRGSFGQAFTNVDYGERVGLAGVEFQESPLTASLISVRWTGFAGLPSIPVVGPSPVFSGTLFVFEQRLKLG
ncbi:MAG: hypothetical protein JO241_11250, partial [Candidatus Eremiobacteraeota bacterium]|nr:hypothetical protein [Candidatus Eremiobacteraeota bacterium]